jgi:hypothetical protein
VRSTGVTSRSSKACGSASHMPVEVEEGAARLVIVLFSDIGVHPSECNKLILYRLNSCTF